MGVGMKSSRTTSTKPAVLQRALALLVTLAHYSYRDIGWDYEALTDDEKKLISEEDFNWMKGLVDEYEKIGGFSRHADG